MAFVVVTGQVFSDNTGASKEMPVLLSPGGPIVPLIDYFLTKRRSLAWQEKVIRSAKLFLEYLAKNMIQEEEEWRLFRNFANALRHGTMNSRTGEDPSGLYWQPVGVDTANRSITLLSDLFDWLGRDENPRSRKFNPRYQGNQYDRHIEHKAFLYG